MLEKTFTIEQIVSVLLDIDAGSDMLEVCRKFDISEELIYEWKQQFGQLIANELHKIKTLEKENLALSQQVDELSMEVQTLKEIIDSHN